MTNFKPPGMGELKVQPVRALQHDGESCTNYIDFGWLAVLYLFLEYWSVLSASSNNDMSYANEN